MSALLAPDMAETILDAYWRRNGESPKLFTIDLARFLMIIKMVVSIAAIVVHFVAFAELMSSFTVPERKDRAWCFLFFLFPC